MAENSLQDPDYLRTVAYRDASLLDARIAFWKRYASGGDSKSQFPFYLAADFPHAFVLEVGSGPGNLWSYALEQQELPSGWSVTVTDLSEGMLDQAQERLGDVGDQFGFEIADVCDLRFDDSNFDLVVARHMLYHAPDIDAALREIKRVLRPGGVLFATTSSNKHIAELNELRNRFSRSPEDGSASPAHMQFSLESGPRILRRYFADVEIHADEEMLKVDDPEIIVNYILSMSGEVNEVSLKRHVEEAIEKEGFYSVTRSSGALVARSDP